MTLKQINFQNHEFVKKPKNIRKINDNCEFLTKSLFDYVYVKIKEKLGLKLIFFAFKILHGSVHRKGKKKQEATIDCRGEEST